MNNRAKKALELFLYFFRIGWFTFGGGWSIVAQLQKDYVEGKKEIEGNELLDIVSVGRSLPGTMVANVTYLFGYHYAGALGGIAAVIGLVLPPVIILTVLTICYGIVKDNIYVARALTGVRSVVAPIILSAVLKLHKQAFPKWFYILFALTSCVLSGIFKVSNILLVVMGVIAGLLVNHNWKGGKAE